MPKKMRFSIVAIAVLVAHFAITSHSIAQTRSQSTTPTADTSPLSVIFVHGYTENLDDLPYCFAQYNDRPLYFNVYSNIKIGNYSQVDLKLYSYNKPDAPVEVNMKMGKDAKDAKDVKGWYVKSFSGNMFTIEIVKEAKPPHLGPGPYMAVISVSPMVKDGVSPMVKGVVQVIGYYRYGTWSKSPFECGYLP